MLFARALSILEKELFPDVQSDKVKLKNIQDSIRSIKILYTKCKALSSLHSKLKS